MSDDAPALTEAQKRVLQLHDKLWNDGSETGRKYRAAAKETFSDISLPEDQFAAATGPLAEENKALREQFTALQTKWEEKEAAEAETKKAQQAIDYEASLNAVRARRNLTEEGFDKMITRMKETGNYTDPDAAAAWVMEQTPPPAPSGPYLGPQNINLYGTAQSDEQFALLHRDPSGQFLDREFAEFTRDPRGYVQSAGFQPDF